MTATSGRAETPTTGGPSLGGDASPGLARVRGAPSKVRERGLPPVSVQDACYVPAWALATPGTVDEIAARCVVEGGGHWPVYPVWRALQRDVRSGRVARLVEEGWTIHRWTRRRQRHFVIRYFLVDSSKRSRNLPKQRRMAL